MSRIITLQIDREELLRELRDTLYPIIEVDVEVDLDEEVTTYTLWCDSGSPDILDKINKVLDNIADTARDVATGILTVKEGTDG